MTFVGTWIRFWMLFAGRSLTGRTASAVAAWALPPHFGRVRLANLKSKGFFAPSARIYHSRFTAGLHPFIDDRVLIMEAGSGGAVTLGDSVRICRDSFLETGAGVTIVIGDRTYIQPRCQICAHKASIQIGRCVQIAAACAFYSYDHSIAAGTSIWDQPLTTRGDIVVGDDAWLGHGVVVLSGVRIGNGAVIGAGAVVTRDIPDGAVAVGSPARIIAMRRSDPVPDLTRHARLHS